MKLIRFCWDFFGMTLASVGFLGGLYLAFIKEQVVISAICVFVAFSIGWVVSTYDITIEETKEELNGAYRSNRQRKAS